MAAQYKLLKTDKGEFYFNLTSNNNQKILASERYKTKNGAMSGIESVKKNAADDSRYVKLTSSDGKFYFRLKAGNNETIGTSEMYNTEQACDKGIEAVKSVGPTASVNDQS